MTKVAMASPVPTNKRRVLLPTPLLKSSLLREHPICNFLVSIMATRYKSVNDGCNRLYSPECRSASAQYSLRPDNLPKRPCWGFLTLAGVGGYPFWGLPLESVPSSNYTETTNRLVAVGTILVDDIRW